MPKKSELKAGRQRVLSEATKDREDDPFKKLADLAKKVSLRQSVRGTARVSGVPASTIIDHLRKPSHWKLDELRRVIESAAEAHRVTVDLAAVKTAARGKGAQAKVAA